MRVGRFKWQARRGIVYPEIQLGYFAIRIPKGPWLFDLENDPDESFDVHERHPEVFARLAQQAEEFRSEITENQRGWRH